MDKLESLIRLCQGRTIYIQTHNFPDPDAIASAFGLQKLLEVYGVKSQLCYDGKLDKLSARKMLNTFQIQMASYEFLAPTLRETDRIICVDTQKNGGNVTDFTGDEVACIDHHPTFVPIEYQYQDIRITGACATLIAEYYALSGNTPGEDVATALLSGMKMDTLQFTRGVTELDIEMFHYLFPHCNRQKLTELERNNMEFSDLRAYGAVIENIQLFDRVGFSYIPFSCPDAMIAILADFILSLNEVDLAIISSFREDGIKLSARTDNPRIHVGNLLHQALKDLGSGGGHATMAGGLISAAHVPELGPYPEDQIRKVILDKLEKS